MMGVKLRLRPPKNLEIIERSPPVLIIRPPRRTTWRLTSKTSAKTTPLKVELTREKNKYRSERRTFPDYPKKELGSTIDL